MFTAPDIGFEKYARHEDFSRKFVLTPNSFSKMLPAEIRKAAPKRTRREILVLACMLYPLYIGLIAYAIPSAYLAGASGFWNLFGMGYVLLMAMGLRLCEAPK